MTSLKESSEKLAVILLAAGNSTRMHSSTPKVLHEIGGAPLYLHALNSVKNLEIYRTLAVVGHGKADIVKSFDAHNLTIVPVVQERRRGTAHAVSIALKELQDHIGLVIVLYGDTPFVKKSTIEKLVTCVHSGIAVGVLGFETQKPDGYGRLVHDQNGTLTRIVEHSDASEKDAAIKLCNSGILCAKRQTLEELVSKVDNHNASGEFYLTDIINIAVCLGKRCTYVTCDEEETLGINSRKDLANAESVFQDRCRDQAMDNGVTLIDPQSVQFSMDTKIGNDVIIEPHVIFSKRVSIDSDARIRSYSLLEDCQVGSGAIVGPFARLRPGTVIGNNARIGNFVEIKASMIGSGSKIQHLSYIGDAEIGQNTNIGAGTIVCNYDGFSKHQTRIGNNSFIGSNTLFIAPVHVGDGVITAAGSVITSDVPDNALAISRTKQTNKSNYADKIRNKNKN